MKADLHTHSHYSDGAYPPALVVKRAKDNGVTTLALSDHDTAAGIPEAVAAGKELGVTIIPAVEFSALWEGRELHILGYGIDTTAKTLGDYATYRNEVSMQRSTLLAEKLTTLGFVLDLEAARAQTKGALKRVHIVKAILNTPENSSLTAQYTGKPNPSVDQFWGALLSEGKPAYIPEILKPLNDIIHLIHEIRGLAVLAHPGLVPWRAHEGDLAPVITAGIDGIECLYAYHTPEQREHYQAIAHNHGLLVTGGSDFHGGNIHPEADVGIGKGDLHVPPELAEKLQEAISSLSLRPPH